MSEMTLEPCPFCDNARIDFCDEGATSFFYCPECGMSGPRGHFRIPAADNWNMLPRRLRWTKEKPTEEGWYWYKDKVTEPIMSLITTLDHKLVMNAYRRYQNAFIDRLDGEYDEEWAGPIPEPEEEQ